MDLKKNFQKICDDLETLLADIAAVMTDETRMNDVVELIEKTKPILIFTIGERLKRKGMQSRLIRNGLSPNAITRFKTVPETFQIDTLLKMYTLMNKIEHPEEISA